MKKLVIIIFSLSLLNVGQAQTMDTLVDVGGHKLHFSIVKGNGVPILFESGNGSDASDWKELLQQIHDSTGATLITYDRAGLGLSGIDTTKMDLPNEVKALETALKKLGYSKNMFLVNHSFGSYYSILFAIRNKRKVTGTVFIEPALPCNYTKKRNKEGNETITPDLWDRIKKEATGLYYVLKNYEAICDLMETKNFPSKIPATVIAAENQAFLKTDAYKNEWRECVKTFGSLPNHTYVFAKNCGHTVWTDNPQLVVHEIVRLYRQTS
jgi:pimeloyl-ACP methyl ester carboxylesterase